jgi:hypothetical protein
MHEQINLLNDHLSDLCGAYRVADVYYRGKGYKLVNADSTMVQLIDEVKLRTIVQSGTAELYLVSIYSNHCIGTRFLLRNADTLEQ